MFGPAGVPSQGVLEPAMTRVLLADDQIQVRSALRLLLEQDNIAQVVGEACDSDQLLTLAAALYPDLVLVDWELPGLHAAGTVAALRAACPKMEIVALSVRPESQSDALAAGADAFVSKGEPPERLLDIVRS